MKSSLAIGLSVSIMGALIGVGGNFNHLLEIRTMLGVFVIGGLSGLVINLLIKMHLW